MTTPTQAASREIVRSYLCGRRMPPLMFDAVVWMAAKRLAEGATPVLDEVLTVVIDSHASPQACCDRPRRAGLSVVCLDLRRSDAAIRKYFPEVRLTY
jgi:hypothetical protein